MFIHCTQLVVDLNCQDLFECSNNDKVTSIASKVLETKFRDGPRRQSVAKCQHLSAVFKLSGYCTTPVRDLLGISKVIKAII